MKGKEYECTDSYARGVRLRVMPCKRVCYWCGKEDAILEALDSDIEGPPGNRTVKTEWRPVCNTCNARVPDPAMPTFSLAGARMSNAERLVARRQRARKLGLCGTCMVRKPQDGMGTCTECLEYRAMRKRAEP
jgi:hypothetical protein